MIKLGLNSCLRKTNKYLGEELSRHRQEKAKALRPKSGEFELVESREANAQGCCAMHRKHSWRWADPSNAI